MSHSGIDTSGYCQVVGGPHVLPECTITYSDAPPLPEPPPHPTTEVTIKKESIDNDMIPLVNFINSHDRVMTHFCCQGRKKHEPPPWLPEDFFDKNIIDKAYVLFTCMDQEALYELVKDLQVLLNYGLNLEVETRDGHLRYTLRIDADELIEINKDLARFSQGD